MSIRRPAERLTEADLRELEGGVSRVPWAVMHRALDEGYEHEGAHVDGWGAGQHFAIFSPTEGGKSHLIRHGLLLLWRHYPVMWVRVKQRDDATRGFGTKVDRYPIVERLKYRVRHRDSPAWDEDPEWFMLQLGAYHFDASASRDQSASWHHARRVCGEALDRCFREGG